ncbi:MAG: ABC transporter substrate-binding protein [Bacteroidota bacterium]
MFFTTRLVSFSIKTLAWSCLLFIGIGFTSCSTDGGDQTETGGSEEAVSPARIVSLNGTLTELLFYLGYGDQIVGVDVTSTYPAEGLDSIARLGHISQLNTEALLALEPDLIVVDQENAEKPSLAQLRSAGIQVVGVPMEEELDNALVVAEVLDSAFAFAPEQMEKLSSQLDHDMEQLASTLEAAKQAENHRIPKVLFIYARGTGRLLVAGSATGAAKMIELSGGKNAITAFEQFETLTPEALIAASPDVILMFESGLASLDGKEGLGQIPGMSTTPAYQADRIITMDGHYLLGFGPRAAQAANELAKQLYPPQTR